MANCRQSRRLLEQIEDIFLNEVIDSSSRGDAVPELLLSCVSKLIGDIRIVGCLGCSDHAMIKFKVLRDIGQAKSKSRKLDFRKANLHLLRQLINKTPWKSVLRVKRAEQSWLL